MEQSRAGIVTTGEEEFTLPSSIQLGTASSVIMAELSVYIDDDSSTANPSQSKSATMSVCDSATSTESTNETVTVCDIATRKEEVFVLEPASIETIAVTPDSQLLLVRSCGQPMKIWNLAKRSVQGMIFKTYFCVCEEVAEYKFIAVSPLQIIGATEENSIEVRDILSGEIDRALIGHTDNISCFCSLTRLFKSDLSGPR